MYMYIYIHTSYISYVCMYTRAHRFRVLYMRTDGPVTLLASVQYILFLMIALTRIFVLRVTIYQSLSLSLSLFLSLSRSLAFSFSRSNRENSFIHSFVRSTTQPPSLSQSSCT